MEALKILEKPGRSQVLLIHRADPDERRQVAQGSSVEECD